MTSAALVEFLSACRYNPAAFSTYDVMAGGLIWDDEVPNTSGRASNLRASVYLRSVIAYRASLTLGSPRVELERDWKELKGLLPNWPGFREDRIRGVAERLLKVHKYKEAKLLDQALSELDAAPSSNSKKV